MLLQSTMMVPRCSALNTPSGPSSTSSTSGESGTIVKMRVARRATSAGDVAALRPRRDDVVHRPLAAAVDDQREARFQQVFRHGPAHEAEPDESNSVRHAAQYSAR